MIFRPRQTSERGASLIELMFSIAIGAVVILAVSRFVNRSRGTLQRSEAQSVLAAASQRIGENLRGGLTGNVAVIADYGGSPDFSNLRSRILASIAASTSAPAIITFTVQPVVQDASKADLSGSGAMANAVGNELFYVSSLSPVTVTVYLSGTALATPTTSSASVQGYIASIDRIQFVGVYLSKETRAMKNGANSMRLVEWRSRPYATLASLTESSGAYLTGTCKGLIAAGYTLAIGDTLTDTAASYYTIGTTGTLTAGAAPATFGEASWAYVDEFVRNQPKQVSPTVSLKRVKQLNIFPGLVMPSSYSVAYNTVTTAASPLASVVFSNMGSDMKPIRVPSWATAERGSVKGFPGGFEVLVAGRPGAREIQTRFVLMIGAGDSVSRTRFDFLASEGQTYSTCDTRY